MLVECLCIPFEFFSFLSKRIFFFSLNPNKAVFFIGLHFKEKEKAEKNENLQWQKLRDIQTRKDCEIRSCLTAPRNQLHLQLLAPLLAPAVALQHARVELVHLSRDSAVKNTIFPGSASSASQVESSNMNKNVEECAKAIRETQTREREEELWKDWKVLKGWGNWGVSVCVSAKTSTGVAKASKIWENLNPEHQV